MTYRSGVYDSFDECLLVARNQYKTRKYVAIEHSKSYTSYEHDGYCSDGDYDNYKRNHVFVDSYYILPDYDMSCGETLSKSRTRYADWHGYYCYSTKYRDLDITVVDLFENIHNRRNIFRSIKRKKGRKRIRYEKRNPSCRNDGPGGNVHLSGL